jgi:hypothetical protein
MLLSGKEIAELKLESVNHSGKRQVERVFSSEPLMKLGVSKRCDEIEILRCEIMRAGFLFLTL